MDQLGDFVVTWQSLLAASNGKYDIYARLYNSAGVARTGEFLVNTYTTGQQERPSVAMDSGGDFVIAWGTQSESSQLDAYEIRAQRYNSSAMAQGGEFEVNSNAIHGQANPSIAMDSAGDFVVAWTSPYSPLLTNSNHVYARRFNSAGVAQDAADVLINTSTAGQQHDPSVAMDASGDYVVAWADTLNFYGRTFNAGGIAQESNEFIVDPRGVGPFGPSAAMDAAGDFVITYTYSTPSSSFDVYAQMYDAAADAQGRPFLVNTFTQNMQARSVVAMDSCW